MPLAAHLFRRRPVQKVEQQPSEIDVGDRAKSTILVKSASHSGLSKWILDYPIGIVKRRASQ